MNRRRAAAAIAVVALLAACSEGSDDAATTTTAAPETTTTTTTDASDATTTTGPFVPGVIEWSGCGGKFECGTVAVPLDYGNRQAGLIELSLIRLPASDKGDRIGSVLVNNGGPGGSPIDFMRSGFRLRGRAGEVFDLVGFDPRGVGASTPIGCGDTVEPFRRLDSGPDTPAEQAALDAGAQAVAEECAAEDGQLLPHVGTDNVARDMDQIRIALGDDKLTYIGFSYGTFVGERYAEMFPERVRAIVLDGVVDPAQDFSEFLAGQTVAIDAAMTRIFDGCGSGCPLDDAAAAYDRVAAAVEEEPLPTGSDRPLGPSELATGAIFVSYDPSAWSAFYRALAAAEDGDGAPISRLAEAYESFGAFTQYAAVECVDTPHPVGSAEFVAFADSLEALSPRFGASVANELLPCAFWPTPPAPEPGDVTAAGAPPILVVGNTGDAATPYSQAVKVAETLSQGALLTYEGEGHTSYGQSPCVNDAVSDYLVDLVTPEPGTVC